MQNFLMRVNSPVNFSIPDYTVAITNFLEEEFQGQSQKEEDNQNQEEVGEVEEDSTQKKKVIQN